MEILGNAEYILDYGCGKDLELINTFAGQHNFCVCGYDPYHLTNYLNLRAICATNLKNITHIVCNNVLNVLQDSDLKRVIKHISLLSFSAQVPVYFTVYQGDKSGNGKKTRKDCYQRNDDFVYYISYLQAHCSGQVIHKNGIIKYIPKGQF